MGPSGKTNLPMKLAGTVRRTYTSIVPAHVRARLERVLAGPYPRVYDRRRFIFIHIPKTAGKSVGRMIGVRGARHLKYRDYEAILGEVIHDYFVFTVVRHPLDRLISAWSYMEGGGNHSQDDLAFRDRFIRPFSSLDDFVLHALRESEVRTLETFMPQVEFLKDMSGHPVDAIKIIRFEFLREGVEALPPHILKRPKLEHINSSVRRPVELSDKALATVADLYREDFQLLDYLVSWIPDGPREVDPSGWTVSASL